MNNFEQEAQEIIIKVIDYAYECGQKGLLNPDNSGVDFIHDLLSQLVALHEQEKHIYHLAKAV